MRSRKITREITPFIVNGEPYITLADTGFLLGVSDTNLRAIMRRKKIRTAKLLNAFVLNLDDVERVEKERIEEGKGLGNVENTEN